MLDTLETTEGTSVQSIGGPPVYAGLVCRRFGFDVTLATKVGADLPAQARAQLEKERIPLSPKQIVDAPTTRFAIASDGIHERRMTLRSKCLPLTLADIVEVDVDCWLVSPVFDEAPAEVLSAIKSDGGKKQFVMLDPQGYMRLAGANGEISLKDRVEIDLSGIRAIKVDPKEMAALTGGKSGLEGMRDLMSSGIELVVSTVPNEIHLLHSDIHYWAKIPQTETPDATGAGDILAGAFCCAYLKERDPLWALCFGAGAVRAALESGQSGLDKIPRMSSIEENASYFYNTIGFRQLS